MPTESIVITIDGGVACGKSTLAHRLAQKLAYVHLDTGAIYRSIALFLERHHIQPDSAPELITSTLDKLRLNFPLQGAAMPFRVQLLHSDAPPEELGEIIRLPRIAGLASAFAALQAVRLRATKLQHAFAKAQRAVVADGRDMGTVVFPAATVKFFLTASVEVRAKRRFLEMQAKGIEGDYAEVLAELQLRDARDSARELSPLLPAKDAIIIDNSDLDLEAQIDIMLAQIAAKIQPNQGK